MIKNLLRTTQLIMIIICLGTNSIVQAMYSSADEDRMNAHPQVQHTGYVEAPPNRADIPWHRKTVSVGTLVLTGLAVFGITLVSTLVPLRAQVSDLEQDNTYLSCCANMNYDAVAQLCPLNVSDAGRAGGNCTPSPQTRRVLWCHPNVAPRNHTFNKCSRLKWH